MWSIYHQLNFPLHLTGKTLKACAAIYGQRFGMTQIPRKMAEAVKIKVELIYRARIFPIPQKSAACSVKGKTTT